MNNTKPSPLVSKHFTDPFEYEEMLTKFETTEKLELVTSDQLLKEYRDYNFEVVRTVPQLDTLKIFVRGAVTRIGAYSNMGKSKFAYWIAMNMLRNGYKGIIFSTEVDRALALANMISVFDSVDFDSVVNKKHPISHETMQALKNLQIYDSRSGALYLQHIKDYIICNKGKIDFVVTDFCQSIKDYQKSGDEYTRLSNLAIEMQQIAQAANVTLIDLSQIANAGLKDDNKNSGFIAFKGSGGLYASADVGILLNRDKVKTPNVMEVQVRKHKYYKTGTALFGVDFARGKFDYLTRQEMNMFYEGDTDSSSDIYNINLK